jgi:hypothetical protein
MTSILRPALICVALCAAACGRSSPSQPTPPPTTPPVTTPPPLVLSGTVTATNGGQPLADVTVEASSIASTTDGGGRYSLSFPAGTAAPSRFTIMGTALVRRTGFLSNGGSRTIDLDAFALDTFDLAYFRAVARNGWAQPATLQPIRRWTRAPMIYIRTMDETGRPIIAEVLQQVASIVSSVVPLYTNGRFGVASIEQGTETRRGQAGWITIEWTRDASEFCGQATVGGEGGFVTLTYDQPGCSCGSQKIRARTVKHELGHSMGLWHSGQGVDLMSGIGVSECDRNMTARELRYLDYLYRRPVGNTDPDNDPGSAVLLAPVSARN